MAVVVVVPNEPWLVFPSKVSSFTCSPALTLLVGQQEENLVSKTAELRGACVVICLECGANDLHMVQLMPLPPHHVLLPQNQEWFILLLTAYPGHSGKKAVKQVAVVEKTLGVSGRIFFSSTTRLQRVAALLSLH